MLTLASLVFAAMVSAVFGLPTDTPYYGRSWLSCVHLSVHLVVQEFSSRIKTPISPLETLEDALIVINIAKF